MTHPPICRSYRGGQALSSPARAAALASLAVLALAWPVAWIVGSWVAHGILVREVERLFDARLEVGSVQFLPPFWLVASDLVLSSDVAGERVVWVRAGEVSATRVGWREGGLPALQVSVDGPVLTSFRTPGGVLDVLDRWRGNATVDEAGEAFGLRWDEAPSWHASGDARALDLARLERRFPQLGGDHVQGILSATGSFSGDLDRDASAWRASLAGSGRMRAREGRFYTIPLVSQLLEQAGLSDAGGTLTEASAEFRNSDGTVYLSQVALGSTVVGAQGDGEVGFDGRVRLDMVVMPFGSWRSAVARGNVPVIGGALAQLAGKARELVGKASGALFAFRITGTVQQPQLTPVSVPSLTRSATSLFDHMASGSWTLDSSVHRRPTER
ncbi:MAG: hypothetical protein FJ148_17100 [Deltaproteobacteria bacterium]|nr:hypothetical protein [Deltaproteobacteria bacterium]